VYISTATRLQISKLLAPLLDTSLHHYLVISFHLLVYLTASVCHVMDPDPHSDRSDPKLDPDPDPKKIIFRIRATAYFDCSV
jgi:hypothetical protein